MACLGTTQIGTNEWSGPGRLTDLGLADLPQAFTDPYVLSMYMFANHHTLCFIHSKIHAASSFSGTFLICHLSPRLGFAASLNSEKHTLTQLV